MALLIPDLQGVLAGLERPGTHRDRSFLEGQQDLYNAP